MITVRYVYKVVRWNKSREVGRSMIDVGPLTLHYYIGKQTKAPGNGKTAGIFCFDNYMDARMCVNNHQYFAGGTKLAILDCVYGGKLLDPDRSKLICGDTLRQVSTRAEAYKVIFNGDAFRTDGGSLPQGTVCVRSVTPVSIVYESGF